MDNNKVLDLFVTKERKYYKNKEKRDKDFIGTSYDYIKKNETKEDNKKIQIETVYGWLLPKLMDLDKKGFRISKFDIELKQMDPEDDTRINELTIRGYNY